jgi:hypothetical protein
MLGDVWPELGVLLVEPNPHGCSGVAVRHDRLYGALGLANAAVDAVALSDDKHGLTFVEATHRADGHAVHIFASYAAFGDDERHPATLCMLIETLSKTGSGHGWSDGIRSVA